MATLADSLLSSSARKLSIRRRPDLLARRQRYLGKSYWVVKDPVGLHYFRFQEEEYAILQMLDGEISLDEVKQRFEDEFPPQKITLDELQQFLGMLHRSGLILASVQGQGEQLLKRRRERRRKELVGAAANILCIRFKGIDPERFLQWLYPKVRWCFSRMAVALSLACMLSAALLVAVQFGTFRAKLPDFYQFFSPANAFLLALTLGLTKILHELGHGLACRHFGGECHEMGIMILVLTPCLYCNVSDSWMLPNKWHRAAIGAAGMYVEVVLASICTFLWWFSEPGLFHHLALNVMFIASVSTVIFNGNPLLRYDGYYILADVLEIPNLRQKATTILGRKAGEWFLGLEPTEDPFLPQRHQVLFALYSVAAVLYRWFIFFSILWFLYRIFKPYRLEVIGWAILTASLGGLVGQPLYQLGKFLQVPGRWDKVKKPRMYGSLAALAAVILAVLFLPYPHSVMATVEVQPRDAASIYVDVPGILTAVHVKPGQRVAAGTELARLDNNELDLKIAQLQGECNVLESKRRNLSYQQSVESQGVAGLAEVEKSLLAKKRQLARLTDEQKRLILKAPCDGTVLPPPSTPKHDDPEGPLPSWHDTPLEPWNLNAYLEEGVLFCQIGEPSQMEAILVVDQADQPFVREGQQQKVDIKLDALPHDTLHGEVVQWSREPLKIAPRRLSAKTKGELPTKYDPDSGVERPLSTSYQGRVPLDDPDGLLLLGFRGRAKIHTDWQTLGQRVWRLLTRTFNFKL